LAILRIVIQYANETDMLDELPQGLVNCYKALEQGYATVHGEDLTQSLPLIEKIMGSVVSEIISRAPRLDVSSDGSIVGYLATNATIATQFDEDAGIAVPINGVLNVLGGNSTAGKNIHTVGAGNTISIILNDSLLFPSTNSSGTQGAIFFNGDRWIHNFSPGGEADGNTFVGRRAGNFSIANGDGNVGIGSFTLENLSGTFGDTALENVAIGNQAGTSITDGSYNCLIGAAAGQVLTLGHGNVCIGLNTGKQLVHGNRNVLIGPDDDTIGTASATGFNLTTTESDNIYIYNVGVTDESNTIRIGTLGTGGGPGQQDACYIAGIFGETIGTPNAAVFIDSTGKLGTIVPPVLASNFEGSSFMAVTASSELLPNLGNQTYYWGTNLAETVLYDDFTSFFPGDGLGIPAKFIAPVAGYYQFTWQCTISIASLSSLTLFIVKNGTTFYNAIKQTNTTAEGFLGTFEVSTTIRLDALDTVEFGVTLNGTTNSPIFFLGSTPHYYTWVMGTLVKSI
jgi:hypothetical protein